MRLSHTELSPTTHTILLTSRLTPPQVLINLALMCMPYASMTAEYAARLETAATVITLIFMLEMVLKLIVYGCQGASSGIRICVRNLAAGNSRCATKP